MLPNPSCINKYSYILKTPTWKVRLLYLFGIISWLLIMVGYWGIIGVDPFYTFFVTPVFILLSIYHLASFTLNLFYKQFNLKTHFKLVSDYQREPPVDIFLPICGEEVDVLRNTWNHITRLNYKNKTVYVLDDSKDNFEAHKQLAQEFGFQYMERPNKGHMKKAGNLKYTFERSEGEFIAIFDADFAPHPDFLLETLPYMENPKVGIVQTPQYFELTDESYKRSPFAYNAAFAEEPFYRFIQVTRNRFGGSICCGSCALYRRKTIEAIGGPYQIDYSEDAHTGYAITKAGYRVSYVPVLLSIGLCPDNQYSFFHQQHRWCMGSMRLMLSKFFWQAKISWKTKFCYITGFMFYMHHPLIIIFSFHLFWTLFFYNEYIPEGKSLAFYPHIIFAIVYLWLFPIAKLRFGYFSLLIARTYAYSHAVKAALLRKSVGWVSTNAKHKQVSSAFRHTTNFVIVYYFCYFLLMLIGFRTGDIHLLDLNYWSIQFWMFWNFFLTYTLLLNLVNTKRKMANEKPLFARLFSALLPMGSEFNARNSGLFVPVRYVFACLIIIGFTSGATTSLLLFHSPIPSSEAKMEIYAQPSVPATITPPGAVMPTTAVTPTPTRATDTPGRTEVVKKEYGGWYWQKDLGHAQQWLGTDSQGNDIWSDAAN